MDDALELLDLAVAGVALYPPASLLDDQLRAGVLGVQRHIDRLKVLHARLLHEADSRRLYARSGYRDMADWLAGKSKTSRGDALSRKRLGEALGASRELDAAAEAGEVSAATAESLFDAVTSVPDGASAGDVADLVEACKGADPRDAREAADVWKTTFSSETPEEAEARRFAKRSLLTKRLGDGMGELRAVLPIVDLRQVTNAITHIAGKPSENDKRTTEQRMADGLLQLAVAYAKGEVTGGRENPNLLIIIDAENPDSAVTSFGDRMPAHVARFLCEQAMVQRVIMAGSHVLDLGRSVRYATEAQYRALVARDGGCRVETCNIPPEWCDVDHLIAWEDGGPTDLCNLGLWCRFHHKLKHSPGVKVLGDINNLRLQLADGTILNCPPKRRRPPQQAAA